MQPGRLGPTTALPASVVVEALLPPLRLDLVSSFVVFTSELNLTRAAERLYVTQPGMSRRLESLERVLGCQLVVKVGQEFALTPAGRAYLPHAEEIVQATHASLATLRQAQPLSRSRD